MCNGGVAIRRELSVSYKLQTGGSCFVPNKIKLKYTVDEVQE